MASTRARLIPCPNTSSPGDDDEHRYRTLVEQIPGLAYVRDREDLSLIRYVSPQVEQLVGRPAQDFIGHIRRWLAIVHPDDRDRLVTEGRAAHRAGRGVEIEYRVLAADGRVVHVLAREAATEHADGRVLPVSGLVVDLSAQRRAEEQVRRSEQVHRSVVEALTEGVIVYDERCRVVACNSSAAAVLGLEPEAVLGCTPPLRPCTFDDGTPVTAETSPARMALLRREPARDLVLRITRPDGEERLISTTLQPLPHAEDGGEVGGGLVASFTDITERRRDEDLLVRAARHDPVTDLPNRLVLEDQASRSVARARCSGRAVAVVQLDIDGLRQIDEALGRGPADTVLRALTTRLRGASAPRIFSPEAPVTSSAYSSATSRASRRCAPTRSQRCSATRSPRRSSVRVTRFHCVGASALHSSLRTPAALRSSFVARPPPSTALGSVATARRSVRPPIGGPDPQSLSCRRSSVARSRATSCCCTSSPSAAPGPARPSRLRRSRAGSTRPAACSVPGSSSRSRNRRASSIRSVIGSWPRSHGAPFVGRQRAPGRACTSNLSPHQLRRSDLARHLLQIVRSVGADPRLLTAEVTETAAMSDLGTAAPALAELAAAGMRIAIDDFGAGHSSLGRLHDLPMHELKIDRSFLAAVPQCPTAAAVVEAVVLLARALGLDAVAEGVETPEQLDLLVRLGCPQAQGFHLGRPMPLAQAEQLLLATGVDAESALHG